MSGSCFSDPLFRVVLVEPEIPQNTGNIGRTCVGTTSDLHLVGQLGFTITDRHLKRAGLDYWQHLTWTHHPTYEAWKEGVPDVRRVFFFSTKAQRLYTDIIFQKGDWLVFGRETRGLPPEILSAHPDQVFKIPMLGPIRSLNAATAVAIVLYEGVRQLGNDSQNPF